MKKLMLSVTVTAAMGLTACGGGDTVEELAQEAEVIHPSSRVAYDPGNTTPVFPIPNDLAFSGTTDGTLHVTGERGLAAGQLPNYMDASTSIGALDGWSTTTPFVIDIDTRPGVTLDAATVAQPGAVHLYEAVLGHPLSPGECKDAPLISACETGDELTFGVDFVTQLQGNQVVVVPLRPLKAKQGYLLALTNQIQDSNGNPIKGSTTYESVRRDIEDLPLPLPSQLDLQYLINSYENGAASKGLDKTTIVYSAVFTTQSVADVTETVKSLMLSGIPGTMPVLHPLSATGVNAALALGLDPDAEGVVASMADLYVGSLTLPYYMELPTPQNCDLLTGNCPTLNGRWHAMGDSPVTVGGAIEAGVLSQESFAAQAIAQNRDPLALLADPAGLVGLTFTVDTPVGAVPLDQNRHLTKFNPLPQIQSVETIDVLSTMPNVDRINGLRAFQAAQTGVPFTEEMMLSKPAGGWPVMIFAHGITRAKEDVLAIAGALANAGIATIAIDHPLHGTRSIDFNGDGIYELSASESFKDDPNLPQFANASSFLYMNLSSLLTGRDNLRQSTVDGLALRLALNGAAGQSAFDLSKVSFLGHSLGSITGLPFATVANSGVRNPATGELSPVNPYQLSSVSLGMTGGGVTGLLLNSPFFGPIVSGALQQSETFQAALLQAGESAGITSAEMLAAVRESDPTSYQSLVDAVLPPFLAQFNFVAQTLLDSADAVNYAQGLASIETPTLVLEVVGDGADNLPDQTVVNSAATAPLSGTEPLISLMGLEAVTSTLGNGTENVSGAVRYTKGHHGSLLDPRPQAGIADDPDATLAATVEMQQQLATFVASDGKMIPVTDVSVVAGAQ